MLGLGLGSHKAKAFRSIVAKLYGKLRHRSTYFENNKEGAKDIKDYKLLDKATILLTPTATSDALVHSVKTNVGGEFVTDGDFPNFDNWTEGTGWTTSSGKAVHTQSVGGGDVYQTLNLQVGRKYLFKAKIDATSDSTMGNTAMQIRNNANTSSVADLRSGDSEILPNVVNDLQIVFTATEVNNLVRFYSIDEISVYDVSITNVSSDFDFDRASSATRINSSGLVQDMQSITDPELVLNGDFEELGSDIVTNGDFSDGTNDWNFVRATIDSGGARINNIGLGGANSYVQQLDVLVVGKTYKMQYDIVATNGKDLVLEKANNLSLDATTTGSKTIYFTQATTTALVVKRNVSETDVTIDNIRIEQIDPNDRWTLGTGWSIEDGKLNFDTDIGNDTATSTNILTVNNIYRMTFDVNITDGVLRFESGDGDNFLISSSGTYTHEFKADLLALKFRRNETPTRGYIDNISVKDITFSTDVDLARISYDSNGDNGHILLEPTSTNLITYSEDFSQWSKEATVTLTPNYGISPDGTRNSTRMQMNADDSIYVSASSGLTASFYVKGTLGETIRLSNGSATTHTLTGNWDRVETYDSSSASSLISINTYSGATARDVEIWGAQAEALSYATSYIPTLTGSTVTRATETLLGSGNSTLINSTEGVLYAEIEALVNGGVDRIISLSDETNDNLIYIRIDNTANRINSFARGGGGTYNTLTVNGVNQTNNNKIALVWDASNVRVWINGSQSLTQSINNSPVGMKTLTFTSPTGGNPFYGKCKALAVFNEALSDDELELLTGVTNYPSFGALAAAGGYTII